MTKQEFSASALRSIRDGHPHWGYIVDHRDQTVYHVTPWLNVREIAADDWWDRHHRDWPLHYQRACLRLDTLHIPRAQTPTSRTTAADS